MGGLTSAIQPQIISSYLPITIFKEEYRISHYPFPFDRTSSDDELLKFTSSILQCFRRLEVKSKKSLDLDPDFCQQQLIELAKWGTLAYQRFFRDEEARQLLTDQLQMTANPISAPTFVSSAIPFPWEVLYQGENYNDPQREMFWGFCYTPARILTPKRDISRHAKEHNLPLDMLFCIHQTLSQSHEQEWPAIRKLIAVTKQDNCCLLNLSGGRAQVKDGESLLQYLNTASHNMLHFACHCKPKEAEIDTLLISVLLDDLEEKITTDLPVIELSAFTFDLVRGQFQRNPLIFLNACQSAGGGDQVRKTLNLPEMFVQQGAASIIATACPVPDLFAAAFAKQFYTFFLEKRMPVGQALRETRLYFLEKHHNPLGLAYGLYSPAHYRLAQSPMMEAA